ncbi:hypothetical protein CHS0354_008433 [Potamilus streckersoni]|uniref:Chitin-binding type-4 domain-containing protein n=1 Tax=Potamilus streckersoni TaxID=2493646 RepID=A0AAE0VHR3_9BIVA|nr:hypothetical protein CHS0354_008433 [Potamilus streckersoni]
MVVVIYVLKILLFFTLMCCSLWRASVQGRAILVEPPHRSSLWRFNYNTTINPQDDNLNCGGYQWQWEKHGGKCGVCGDRFNGSQDNDDKGKYASGIIVRHYLEGRYLNITFDISNNLLGYVEFKLCPRNGTTWGLNQSCFDQYPLWINESDGYRYYIGSLGGIYDIHVFPPKSVTCTHCVLQWKFVTGRPRWHEDDCRCLDREKREQYINCADVEILPRGDWQIESRKPDDIFTTTEADGDQAEENGGSSHLTEDQENTIPTKPPPHKVTTHTSRVTMVQHPSPTDRIITPTITQKPPVQPDIKRSTQLFSGTLSPSFTTPLSTTYRPLEDDLKPSLAPVLVSKPEFPVVMTTSRLPSPMLLRSSSVSQIHARTELAKIFFSVPILAENNLHHGKITTMISPPNIIVPTATSVRPLSSTVTIPPSSVTANTQFVSVSDILNRFYPNYIPPYIFPPMLLPDPETWPGRKRQSQNTTCNVWSENFRCVGSGIYQRSLGINHWCELNCRVNNCIIFMCTCSCDDVIPLVKSKCHAVGEFRGVEGMDQWCTANCKVGYCPSNTCSVQDCMEMELSDNSIL